MARQECTAHPEQQGLPDVGWYGIPEHALSDDLGESQPPLALHRAAASGHKGHSFRRAVLT